jgi:CheY-like chemotaxis protein
MWARRTISQRGSSRTPIILLVEDDEFDRTTLTRMLEERGCDVITTRGKHALDTFSLNHTHLALVLASARLSDAERIRLSDGLSRIAPRMPVIMARQHASHRPNSGQAGERPALFAELLREVQRRLQAASAQAPAPGLSVRHLAVDGHQAFVRKSKPAFNWPMLDDELNDIEGIHPATDRTVTQGTAPQDGDTDLDERVWRVERTPLLEITSPDPRDYFAALQRERRARLQRVGRIAAAIAGGSALLMLITLLQMPRTTARGVEDAPVAMTRSGSISVPGGIVALVSAAQVTGYPADHLATLRAGTHAAPARQPFRHQRRGGSRFDRVNAVVSRRRRPR